MAFFSPVINTKYSRFFAFFTLTLYSSLQNTLSSLHIFVHHCTFCVSLHVKTCPGSETGGINAQRRRSHMAPEVHSFIHSFTHSFIHSAISIAPLQVLYY